MNPELTDSVMPPPAHIQLQQAYEHCQAMVRSHYENFPVASVILPRHLRQPISVIYAFARTADDFADEGDLEPQARLDALNDMARKLDQISESPASSEKSSVDDPTFVALADVVHQHKLPLQLFHDLLTAFRQDVTTKRYASFDDVLFYCRHSANPVGRLLLHLLKQDSETNLARSDAVCSALQLINFYQDVLQDYDENNRIYIPGDEMATHGITDQHFKERICNADFQVLLAQQYQRARNMIISGAPLGCDITGRFGLQLRMMINGGIKVLDLLEQQNARCFTRPRLGKLHWLDIIVSAIFKKKSHN